MDPATLARAHRRDMAALNSLAKRDISVAFSRITNPDARVVRDTLELVLPELAQTYGSASATLAADWYDEVRRDQKMGGRFRAIASKLPDKGRTEALAGWAVNPLFSSAPDREATLSKLTGGFQKLVSDVNRDTIRGSALADPDARGWQRVGAGGCDFCRMLIGRGAVYSEETADFASHDHCRCSAYPILGDMGTIDIMEPAALTPDEALARYTTSEAFEINNALRQGKEPTEIVKVLDGMFEPATTSIPARRVITYNEKYALLQAADENGVYVDRGFASTQKVSYGSMQDLIDDFAPSGSPAVMEFTIPKGFPVIDVGTPEGGLGFDQGEILLPRGTQFKVISWKLGPDRVPIVKIRLIKPPPQR